MTDPHNTKDTESVEFDIPGRMQQATQIPLKRVLTDAEKERELVETVKHLAKTLANTPALDE